MVHVPGFAEGAEPTSGLLLHPLAMRLILGIDPDSHLQGGWQSASERLKNGPSGRRHTPQRTRLEARSGRQAEATEARIRERGRAGRKLAMARSGASIGAPGRHAERHVSPRGSSTVSGYGSVDPGSADRWRNTKLSRKYAPFVLARWAAQLSKNFGRKSGPPKFR